MSPAATPYLPLPEDLLNRSVRARSTWRRRVLARSAATGSLVLAVTGVLGASTNVAQAATCQTGSAAFIAIGAEQCYEVPAGITSVEVLAVGGAGSAGLTGGSRPGEGADGAQVSGTISVTPGQTLYVEVGGRGAGVGGWNGGGNSIGGSGGGGGASDVRSVSCAGSCPGGGETLNSRLLIAAGGGGGGSAFGSAAGGDGGGSGLGGPPQGLAGHVGEGGAQAGAGGDGATLSSGGAGGAAGGFAPCPFFGFPGVPGTAGNGGAAAFGLEAGGGGGGGY